MTCDATEQAQAKRISPKASDPIRNECPRALPAPDRTWAPPGHTGHLPASCTLSARLQASASVACCNGLSSALDNGRDALVKSGPTRCAPRRRGRRPIRHDEQKQGGGAEPVIYRAARLAARHLCLPAGRPRRIFGCSSSHDRLACTMGLLRFSKIDGWMVGCYRWCRQCRAIAYEFSHPPPETRPWHASLEIC